MNIEPQFFNSHRAKIINYPFTESIGKCLKADKHANLVWEDGYVGDVFELFAHGSNQEEIVNKIQEARDMLPELAGNYWAKSWMIGSKKDFGIFFQVFLSNEDNPRRSSLIGPPRSLKMALMSRPVIMIANDAALVLPA